MQTESASGNAAYRVGNWAFDRLLFGVHIPVLLPGSWQLDGRFPVFVAKIRHILVPGRIGYTSKRNKE